MSVRIEWRTRAEGDDTLLTVDEAGDRVLQVATADPSLLTDFLNDMTGFRAHNGGGGHPEEPYNWGALVIARSESGEVLDIDPQLYWEGVAYWFRSRGSDPHLWRGRSASSA